MRRDYKLMHKLTCKVAQSFYKTSRVKLEIQDLIQEAALSYLEAKQKYDPSKGYKFSTFIYFCMANQLKTYVKKEKEYQLPLVREIPKNV